MCKSLIERHGGLIDKDIRHAYSPVHESRSIRYIKWGEQSRALYL